MAVTKKTVRETDDSGSANIKPATDFEASGAVIEPAAKDVDMSHPAVDANPRANTTVKMNEIDFNDPHKSPKEASADNLKKA